MLGSIEEQTHLLALCDSTDGAPGLTLAAWKERGEQESQKIDQPLRRSLLGDSNHHSRGYRLDKWGWELVK